MLHVSLYHSVQKSNDQRYATFDSFVLLLFGINYVCHKYQPDCLYRKTLSLKYYACIREVDNINNDDHDHDHYHDGDNDDDDVDDDDDDDDDDDHHHHHHHHHYHHHDNNNDNGKENENNIVNNNIGMLSLLQC